MELTQMKYFLKLAEELNFTEAAKKLFITQSTLSLSIKKLEEECGTPLFDRIGKGTYLTEAGKVFVNFAKRAIEETETGLKSIKECNGIYTGKLQIGVVYSLHNVLNSCVLDFTNQYPDARLSIIESNSVKELAELVAKRKLDLALTYSLRGMSQRIESYQLFEKPLSVIAEKNHPMATRKRISLNELHALPFIFFPEGIHTRMVIDEMFLEHNVPPITPRIEVNDASLILKMVETGQWLTILSEGVTANRETLKAIPITGTHSTLRGCLIRPKDKYKTVLENAFSTIVKKHWDGTTVS